jgi:hypothetical protein
MLHGWWSGFAIRELPKPQTRKANINPELHQEHILLVVLWILTFANMLIQPGCECQNRTANTTAREMRPRQILCDWRAFSKMNWMGYRRSELPAPEAERKLRKAGDSQIAR